MSNSDGWFVAFFALCGLAFVAIIVIATTETVRGTAVERECLAHGWPHGDWRWVGPAYCIKRVGQTDTVATLDQIRGRR